MDSLLSVARQGIGQRGSSRLDRELAAREALDELGAILLDVLSVCETLPGKLDAGNSPGALTEIEWLAARVKEAGNVG